MRFFVYDLTSFQSSGPPAVLDDWQLVLSGASASIEPKIGSVVYGVLLDRAATPPDYETVDVEARLWSPGGADVTVRLEQAVAFVARPGTTATPPATWIDGVIANARRVGLPAEWTEELEGLKGKKP
jgi:hypothetical protein